MDKLNKGWIPTKEKGVLNKEYTKKVSNWNIYSMFDKSITFLSETFLIKNLETENKSTNLITMITKLINKKSFFTIFILILQKEVVQNLNFVI